ncbi:carbohydrate sulfotransferase 12-like [Colossoma macropomum]|uniref:carbohydrate sulfotransferase 12-like n=1 Tax=Colossoma macropomum TaxID=42526 RepID=UPI0018640BB5|nr:carbohydrate sulfotransferase 12-like [Colossoma macropomum]
MNMPRLLQFFLFLVSFSLTFVYFWSLDVRENKFSLSSEHRTSLQRCSNQAEDQLSSTYCQDCSRYGTLSRESSGAAAPNEDLEGVDASRYAQLKLLDLQHRQYARKKLIRDMCRHNGALRFSKRATFSDIPNDQLANLVVDDRHGIIYCYVPKVACTEWKSIMIFLSESLKVNGTPYKNHSDIPRDLIHGNSVVYLNRSHRNMMKWKIKKYKKFLFVRNPFVRLISAYRDKFEKKNDYFYKFLAVPIMRRYKNLFPPSSAEQAHIAGIRPSFSDFIQYILDLPDDDGSSFEEHWRQVYNLCHPCQIEYDFIGKMETMYEDAQHLLRVLKVDHIVHFPPGTSNRTEESWIKTWFTSIPIEWRRKLYKIYEPDFQLFGYSLPENLYDNAAPIRRVLEIRRKG